MRGTLSPGTISWTWRHILDIRLILYWVSCKSNIEKMGWRQKEQRTKQQNERRVSVLQSFLQSWTRRLPLKQLPPLYCQVPLQYPSLVRREQNLANVQPHPLQSQQALPKEPNKQDHELPIILLKLRIRSSWAQTRRSPNALRETC